MLSSIASLATAKVLSGTALAAVAVSGTAAAYTGNLPTPLQEAAATVGAPDPSEPTEELEVVEEAGEDGDATQVQESEESEPVEVEPVEDTEAENAEDAEEAKKGPDATGPAAFGLCNAWSHGGLNETSTAYASLVVAAAGEDGIELYCEGVIEAKKAAKDDAEPAEDGTGEVTEPAEDGDEAGKPEKTGKPEKAGKPDTAGKPEGAGKPDKAPRR